MNVFIFYGSNVEFQKYLPDSHISVVDLALKDDDERRKFKVEVPGQEDESNDQDVLETYANVVGYSDDFSSLTEGAIESFVGFISRYCIERLFLQNPPESIARHIKELTTITCDIKHQSYNVLDIKKLQKLNRNFSNRIIGQERALHQIVGALYYSARKRYKKPCVMLFYGSTGVGKTETAKYIAEIMKEPIFRKQFSMFHSEEFTAYLFGGKHNQNSFAKELLERESNVILLDEFDKPDPVFFSAFYQLFDEGIYSDKNYSLRMENAIIICTSNFQSEEQIRERLGDPMFSRFDAIIRFDDLSNDDVNELVCREYNRQYHSLNKKEKAIVDQYDVLKKILVYSSRLKNARQIRRVVREAITENLINQLL